MAEMQRLEIVPILDLMHFGVPDFIGDFQNPELPLHFAAYAEAVAKRYPQVRYYTPVNEIYVTARISAQDGGWNERLQSDRGFITALKHCVAASIMGTHAIARQRPDCIIVQSESAEYIHQASASPSPEIKLRNALRFLSRMRSDGVPVLGFTWYSLTDQVDWNTALTEQNGKVNECGLFDLNREPRPVARAYRQLLEEFGQITIVPHGEIFEITPRSARLKIEV